MIAGTRTDGDDLLLTAAIEAAGTGAAMMLDRSGMRVYAKGDRDEVSSKDLAIERELRNLLETGQRGFLGEEDGSTGPGQEKWVLDPVDGTVNYVQGLPLCGLSLALVREGVPVLGVIELPFLGVRYWARHGHGAYRQRPGWNVQQIRVSTQERLYDSVIAIGDYATGQYADRLNAERLEVTRLLAARAMRVRMLGTAAGDLALTADGRLDGCLSLVNRPWDNAAGAVILAEAGALVTDADGEPYTTESREIIAGPPAITRELAALVREARHALLHGSGISAA